MILYSVFVTDLQNTSETWILFVTRSRTNIWKQGKDKERMKNEVDDSDVAIAMCEGIKVEIQELKNVV